MDATHETLNIFRGLAAFDHDIRQDFFAILVWIRLSRCDDAKRRNE
jgi:hypothetical protein